MFRFEWSRDHNNQHYFDKKFVVGNSRSTWNNNNNNNSLNFKRKFQETNCIKVFYFVII